MRKRRGVGDGGGGRAGLWQGWGGGGSWDFMLFAVGTLWRAVSGGVGSSKVRLETKPLAAAQSELAQGGWK